MALALASVGAVSPPCRAGSLRTPFAKVVIEGLAVGHATRVRLADGRRYCLENTSETDVGVAVTVRQPRRSDLRGVPYEPIPDIAWVTVSPTNIVVPAHGKAEADVLVSVPKDAAYANKKYEVWLRAATTGGQFGVALITRLRIHTTEKPRPDQLPKPRPEEGGAAERSKETTSR